MANDYHEAQAMKSVYLAWIEYLHGTRSNLVGVFSTPELAQEACLAHHRREAYKDGTLEWARARNIVYHASSNQGSYSYEVYQETLDPVITYPTT